MTAYLKGLELGSDLPSTELQPADDLALLAANGYIMLWSLSKDDAYLYRAVSVLEFALTKSKQSFLARLMLIQLYRLLGRYHIADSCRLLLIFRARCSQSCARTLSCHAHQASSAWYPVTFYSFPCFDSFIGRNRWPHFRDGVFGINSDLFEQLARGMLLYLVLVLANRVILDGWFYSSSIHCREILSGSVTKRRNHSVELTSKLDSWVYWVWGETR